MKNTYIKASLAVAMSVAMFTSCSKFDDINTNPNASTSVTPGMLATGMLINMTKQNQEYGSFIDHNLLSKHALTYELIRDAQYNKLTRTGFGVYGSLRNIDKMVNNAADNVKDSYKALGLFIKAYRLFYLSLDCGDIPYAESLKGESEGITQPAYDSQKEVMQQILADLAEAEELFQDARNFDGDPILKGNVANWVKVVNAFRIKVLINLYLHDNDAELKVKETFQQLVNNNRLLSSNEENFQLVYSNKGGQIYPFNDVQARSNDYCLLSSNLVDSLKAYKDNRLFYFAEPSEYCLNQGIDESSFDAYISIDPTLPFSSITALSVEKKFAGLNKRYTDLNNPDGEPIVRIGYAEQCFNIAEGIVRGWAEGDAKAYYEAGVKAAMAFVKTYTPVEYVVGRPQITNTTIDDYLASPKVAFALTKDLQLKQLFQQKYFIYFLQNPWDGYYETRRTGYPELPINPDTNQNTISDQMPKRWMYPQNEYNENSENIQEAINRQFGGKDDNNDLMWILRK